MRRIAVLPLLLVSLAASAQTLVLSDGQWSAVRTARDVVALEGFSDLITVFERQPQGLLLVRHGRDESDRARAEALRSHLVALGISSARIQLEPDALPAGRLELEARAHGMRP